MSNIIDAFTSLNIKLETIGADISALKEAVRPQLDPFPHNGSSPVTVNSAPNSNHEKHHDQTVISLEEFEFDRDEIENTPLNCNPQTSRQ